MRNAECAAVPSRGEKGASLKPTSRFILVLVLLLVRERPGKIEDEDENEDAEEANIASDEVAEGALPGQGFGGAGAVGASAARSADFPACRIADFPVGRPPGHQTPPPTPGAFGLAALRRLEKLRYGRLESLRYAALPERLRYARTLRAQAFEVPRHTSG